MKNYTKKIIITLCIAAMLLGLVGCSNSGGVEENSGETLRVQICAEPESLDPAMDYAPGEFYTTPQICDTLLNLTSDLEMEPNICSEWNKVDDLTYVYKIRDDVNFSDGTKMTMDDVIYCINRIIDPEVGSKVSWMLTSVQSVEQTGDWEMTIKLSKPDSMFQYTMALAPGMIYSKESCENAGGSFGTAAGGIIGTGPYVLNNWTSGMEINMSINENYWKGTDDIDIKNLQFKIISDDSATVTAANAGEIDFITLLAGDYLKQVNEEFDLKVVESTEDRCFFFNCKQKYTGDVNVRKALACCFNRDVFMDFLYQDRYTKCNGLLFGEKLYPDSSWKNFASDFPYNYEYNLDKAKEYLAQSEYPDGGFEITALVAANNGTEMKEAQMFQEAAKEIGITVTLKTVSDAELQNVLFVGDATTGIRDYDVYVSGWISDYPDSMGYFEFLLASWNDVDGALNFSQYNSEEFDNLLRDVHEAKDEESRSEILKEVALKVGEDCPIAPLGYNKSFFLLRNGYEYTFNGMDVWGMYLKNVKKTK